VPDAAALGAASCAGCGTELAPNLLSCPGCHALVHAGALTRLASEAEGAEREGRVADALVHWREALDLLPHASRQHAAIVERVTALTRQVDAAPRDDGMRARLLAKGTVIGTLALLAWKFKFVVVFLLTKGKLLLLGLTKGGTLLSMLASFGVYAGIRGWQLAAGVILSIYIHEMGHVAALSRYGIRATAPMFIPGFGALIRLRQRLHSEREEARVGLAGPEWGLGAALVSYALWLATGAPIWGAIAKLGAGLNLFNLIPIWQLDGAHAFRALSRAGRLAAILVASACGAAVHRFAPNPLANVIYIGLLACSALTLLAPGAREPDRGALWRYLFLVTTLSALLLVPLAAGR
jgi:Zn-dependent protease